MVAATGEFDKVHVNDGFPMFVVKGVVSKNSYRAIKDIDGVGVLMRITVMTKFRCGFNLKDIWGG